MDTGVDFLAENLLGTLDGQCCHLLTQGFTGFHGLLLGFNPGGSNNLVAFVRGLGLGFFNDGLCATLGISQACGGLVARLGQLVFYPLVGGGEFGFGLVGGGEAVSDSRKLLCSSSCSSSRMTRS